MKDSLTGMQHCRIHNQKAARGAGIEAAVGPAQMLVQLLVVDSEDDLQMPAAADGLLAVDSYQESHPDMGEVLDCRSRSWR